MASENAKLYYLYKYNQYKFILLLFSIYSIFYKTLQYISFAGMQYFSYSRYTRLFLKNSIIFFLLFSYIGSTAQTSLVKKVNVFLGTSGDHGQMSPAASYPYGLLSAGPQTYPNTHTGYEYAAKEFLGFTQTRFEGVGCTGSGGNILVKPFTDSANETLIKTAQYAEPGFYTVSFTSGIGTQIAVLKNTAIYDFSFPQNKKGLYIDFSHTLSNLFIDEVHQINNDNSISGWVKSGTTCNAGEYTIYYYIEFNQSIQWNKNNAHTISAITNSKSRKIEMRISVSAVSSDHAKQSMYEGAYDQLKQSAQNDWNNVLGSIKVIGDSAKENLFYSLLYRTMQSPYMISENDGSYKSIDGSLQKSTIEKYNGWAIWDNYKTQLPLLSIIQPDRYKHIIASIADLYHYGKKDYATQHEASNTVRTEHAIVVLLDAYRKGFPVNFNNMLDSLIAENNRLDFSKPDKALESSYDTWALAEILQIINKKDVARQYMQKALEYKKYWNKDFKDITKNDVDRMQARQLYQGTIWQYRWFVPFDIQGLIKLIGSKEEYERQLDLFFNNDLYNHANEPDIQVPYLYNTTAHPAKSQSLIYKLASDTVIQYYFNDNSRGIDPFVDRIYKNEPKAYIRTMDDDAGAMSGWYVFAACGLSPACVGWPIYYIHVPQFRKVIFNLPENKSFTIEVKNESPKNRYVQSVRLDGKPLLRNYITHEEITRGGILQITAGSQPSDWGTQQQWISEVKD